MTIFSLMENEPTGEPDETITVEEVSGIDKQHYALFESLIRKDKWTREEGKVLVPECAESLLGEARLILVIA
jgi:hypothetical protein